VLFAGALVLVWQSQGARLRARHESIEGEVEASHVRRATDASGPANATTALEVLENKSLTVREVKECLCHVGEFWHSRLNKCIKQGGWGYECGFFPREHHDRVCKDGLVCKPIGNKDTYISHGMYRGTAGSIPATCVDCTPEDKCQTGEERHREDCLMESKLSGEACATVRVVLPPARASATATRSHTAQVNVTKEASANATAEVPPDGQIIANATVTHEASAERTEESSHTAAREAEAAAEATECMTAAEAMRMFGHGEQQRLHVDLAAEIASAADAKVLELASEEAKKLAAEKGLLDAQEAANKTAGAKALEKARSKAEAAAQEAAAQEAEAGARKKAQEAAQKSAEEKAKEAAAKAKESTTQTVTTASTTQAVTTDSTTQAATTATTASTTQAAAAASTSQAPAPPQVPPGPPVLEPLVSPQAPVEDKNTYRKISDEDFEATRP